MPRTQDAMTEERIVQLKIDNEQFEKGAKKTISTLEKLDAALKLEGDTEALDEISDKVAKFDASPMSKAFDMAADAISAKGVAIRQVIKNITDDIYHFSTKTVKELTVDQISSGFKKYASIGDTTQMLMAATKEQFEGMDPEEQLGVIDSYLEKLVWYTDETSYNLESMISTAGKFVNVGVQIDDAFQAMMGIASLGATAGAKPQQVTHVMDYAVAQAMSMGKMLSQDWRTIENANMATTEFKKNVLSIAEEFGKIEIWDKDTGDEWLYGVVGDAVKSTDDLFNDMVRFRDSLSKGWFDTEVMTEVFKRYGEFSERLYTLVSAGSGDLSTYDALELLEDFRANEAAVDWVKWADSIGITADELKSLVKALDDVQWEYSETGFKMGQEYKTWTDVVDATKDAVSTGWMKIFRTIFGNYLEAKDLWTEVGELFYNIFVEPLNHFNSALSAWKRDGGRDSLIQGFRNLVNAISKIVQPITGGLAKLLGLDDTDKAGKRLANLSKIFANITFVIEKLAGLIGGAINIIFKAVEWITTPIREFHELLIEVFGDMPSLNDLFDSIDFKNPEQILLKVLGLYERVSDKIREFFGLKTKYKNDSLPGITDLIPFAKGNILTRIINFFGNLRDIVVAFFTNLKAVVTGDLPFTEFLSKIQSGMSELIPTADQVKEKFEGIAETVKKWLGLDKKNQNGSLPGMPSRSGMNQEVSFLDKLFAKAQEISDYLTNPDNIFGKIWETVTGIGEGFGIMFRALFGNFDKEKLKLNVQEYLKAMFDAIKDYFSNLSMEDVLSMGRAAIVILVLAKIADAINQFRIAAQDVTQIGSNLNGALLDLQKTFRANAFLKIAVGITAIAASMYLLAKIPADRLEHVGTIMIALLLGLALLAKVVGNGNKNLFKFFSHDTNKMLSENTYTLKDILTNFGNQNKLIERLTINVIPQLAANLIALAIMMGVIAWSIVKLKEAAIQGWEDIKFPVYLLAGIAAGIIVMAGILGVMNKTLKDVKYGGIALAIIAIGIAMRMMIKPFTELAKIADAYRWETLVEAIGIFGGIALAIMGMAAASSMMNFNKVFGAALGFVAMSLAMRMMIKPFQTLTEIAYQYKWETLLEAVGLFVAIAAVMAGLAAASRLMNIDKILGAAVGFIAISFAVRMMIKPLTELIALAEQYKWQTLVEGMGLMLGIAAALAVIAWGISHIGTERIIATAIAMVIVAAALRVLIKPLLDFATTVEDVWTAAGSMGFAVAALAGLALILGALAWVCSKLSPYKIIPVAIGMVILAAAMRIMSGALIILADFVMQKIQEIGWETIANNLSSFSTALGNLVALAAATVLFGAAIYLAGSGIMKFGIGVLAGAAGAALFAIALLGISLAIGVLGMALPLLVNGLILTADLLIAGADKLLELIGIVIVGVAGVILAKKLILAKAAASLILTVLTVIASMSPEFQLTLVELFTKLVGFLERVMGPFVNSILSLILSALEALADALRANEARIFHVITDIGEFLLELLIRGATWVVGGLIGYIAESVVMAIDSLLPKGDFGQKIREFLEIDKAYEQLDNFQTFLSQGLDFEGLKKWLVYPNPKESEQAGKEGGEAYARGQEEALAEEAAALAALNANRSGGRKLTATGTAGHGTNKTDTAEEAGKEDAAAYVEAYTTTLISEPITDNVAEEFQNNVLGFVDNSDVSYEAGQKTADQYVAGIEDESSVLEEAKKKLEDSSTGLSATDILANLFGGENGAGTAIDANQFMSAFGLSGLGLNTEQGWANMFTGGQSLSIGSFFGNLFGTGEGGSGSSFSLSDMSSLFDVSGLGLNTEQGWANMFTGGAGLSVDTFFSDLFDSSGDVETASGFLSQFQSMASTAGTDFDSFFGQAITDGAGLVTGNAQGMVDSLQGQVDGVIGNMDTNGWNVDAGLANGIYSGSWMPIGAMSELSVSMQNAFTNSWVIASPSRVAAALAAYIPAGIAQGINQNGSEAIESVTILGDQLIMAMQEAMLQVAMATDENYDMSPRITPVVDLSNASAGAASLNGMFSGTRSVDFTSSISRQMQEAQRSMTSMAQAQQAAANISNGDNIVVNVYASEGMDEQTLADAVISRLSARVSRRGVAFG